MRPQLSGAPPLFLTLYKVDLQSLGRQWVGEEKKRKWREKRARRGEREDRREERREKSEAEGTGCVYVKGLWTMGFQKQI